MNIRKLIWDSNFFGFDVGEIDESEISSVEKLNEVIDLAREKSFRLCYLKIGCENKLSDEIAKLPIGLLVDKKVTYSFRGLNELVLVKQTNIIDYNKNLSIDEFHSLAIQSSHESRFRIDKNFPVNKCDEMYNIWIDRSISGEIAKKVLAYVENNSVKGMITLNIENGVGIIGLIGVDLNERGKNIGKKLINESFRYFKENNIYSINVDTQLRNVGACKFYEKCGFLILKITNIYHFWL